MQPYEILKSHKFMQCSWIERFCIQAFSSDSGASQCHFNFNPKKIFIDLQKLIKKIFFWKHKCQGIANEKKHRGKARGDKKVNLTKLRIKLYKATLSKTV